MLLPLPCRGVAAHVAAVAAAAAAAVLELVRDVATALAADGRRVKVSVQQALGQGVFQASGAGRAGQTCMHARPCVRCVGPCLLPPSGRAASPPGSAGVCALDWLMAGLWRNAEPAPAALFALSCPRLPSPALPCCWCAGHPSVPQRHHAHHEANGLGRQKRCGATGTGTALLVAPAGVGAPWMCCAQG